MRPPLVNDHFVSSNEENVHHRTKLFRDEKLSRYAKQIGRHLIFSPFSPKDNFNNEKDIDEEFDQISLSDNYYVSLF